jgi:hypothetical protein
MDWMASQALAAQIGDRVRFLLQIASRSLEAAWAGGSLRLAASSLE